MKIFYAATHPALMFHMEHFYNIISVIISLQSGRKCDIIIVNNYFGGIINGRTNTPYGLEQLGLLRRVCM